VRRTSEPEKERGGKEDLRKEKRRNCTRRGGTKLGE
jgi:hypothetical protein